MLSLSGSFAVAVLDCRCKTKVLSRLLASCVYKCMLSEDI